MTVLHRKRASEGFTPILASPPPPDALLRFWHELSGDCWTGRLQELHPLTNLNYVWWGWTSDCTHGGHRMNRIYLALAKWAARKAGGHTADPRKCARCQQPRRLRDKIHTLAWEHDCCDHPATHPLPETLMSEMEKGRV